MSRRGNPHDNAKAESFIKTLKVEAAYLMAYEENFFTFHRRLLRVTRRQYPHVSAQMTGETYIVTYVELTPANTGQAAELFAPPSVT